MRDTVLASAAASTRAGVRRAARARHHVHCEQHGDYGDNVMAARFFAMRRVELIARAGWRTGEEDRAAIFDSIEVCYNRRRLHVGRRSMRAEAPTETATRGTSLIVAEVSTVGRGPILLSRR